MAEHLFQRLADDSDVASATELRFNEDALRRTLARGARSIDPRFDGTHCVDCAVAIPAARLALGKTTCIACQELVERRARLFRS